MNKRLTAFEKQNAEYFFDVLSNRNIKNLNQLNRILKDNGFTSINHWYRILKLHQIKCTPENNRTTTYNNDKKIFIRKHGNQWVIKSFKDDILIENFSLEYNIFNNFEEKIIYRFKTLKEFISEFGEDWRGEVSYHFITEMDYLLGTEVTEEQYNYSINNLLRIGHFSISSQMLKKEIISEIPAELKTIIDSIDDDNKNYTFGVEIEFLSNINGEDFCKYLDDNDLEIVNKSDEYGRSSTEKWVLCYDSSVHNENYRYGYELTTPILQGKKGIYDLFRYMLVMKKLLSEEKIGISKKCGLHVHLGNFGDFNVAVDFLKEYSINEHFIDLLMPESRRLDNNGFCRKIRTSDWEEKYQKVSLRKYNLNGTFEVRHHSGTLNFTKIANWIIFNMNLITKIKKESVATVEYKNIFELLTAIVGNNINIFNYFIKRYVSLNSMEDANLFVEENA
jgi:hypothetical protein